MYIVSKPGFRHWQFILYIILILGSSGLYPGANWLNAPPSLGISITPFQAFCANNAIGCADSVRIECSVTSSCSLGQPVLTLEINGQPAAGALSGAFPDYIIQGVFETGEHTFALQALDSCGNTAEYSGTFEVVDCLAPSVTFATSLTAILQDLSPNADINGDGIPDNTGVQVFASGFLLEQSEDCTPPLRYSIHRLANVNNGSDIPNPEQSYIWVNCYEPEPLYVQLYAWDSADNPYSLQPDGTLGGPNYKSYWAYVIVGDPFEVCYSPYCFLHIEGEVLTPEDEGFANLPIVVENQVDTFVSHTGPSGFYHVNLPPSTISYTLKPVYNENAKNGVSTFDLILITKHILGVQPLSNPYYRIAADVNGSQHISTQDVIAIRRVILGLDNTFPNNVNWRYIIDSYEFPNPQNPWQEPFPESIEFHDYPDCSDWRQGFIVVKIGDVNGSVIVN